MPRLQRLSELTNENDKRWQSNKQNTWLIETSRVAGIGLGLFQCSPNQESIGSGKSTWKVARPHIVPVLEAKSSKVLGGVASVAESARSRGRPGGNFSEVTSNVQSKSGVNILNCSESNFVSKKWVSNNEQVLAKFQRWNDVVRKDKTQSQQDYCCSLPASFWFGEFESVDERKAGHDDGKDCNQIAGRRSFHPVIFARKEQKNG